MSLSIKGKDYSGGSFREGMNGTFGFLGLTTEILLLSDGMVEKPRSAFLGVHDDAIPAALTNLMLPGILLWRKKRRAKKPFAQTEAAFRDFKRLWSSLSRNVGLVWASLLRRFICSFLNESKRWERGTDLAIEDFAARS